MVGVLCLRKHTCRKVFAGPGNHDNSAVWIHREAVKTFFDFPIIIFNLCERMDGVKCIIIIILLPECSIHGVAFLWSVDGDLSDIGRWACH